MRRLPPLALAGLLALALPSLGGCSLVTLDFQPKIRPLQEETVEGKGSSKILLLDLSGMLSEDLPSFSLTAPPPRVPLLARVREELAKAEKDDQVRALIVRINSPGGTITASDVLYHEILAFKQRRKVPVIAAIMDVGASGGYYAALAADTIVVNPTTITGSIGVVMVTVNAQGLMEKIGVAPLAIKSGPMKDAGSPFRSLTGPELAVFQNIIDEMYGRFVGLIVQSRKLPEDRVRALADGRVYTADQALRLGLVDRIGYLEDVVKLARETAKVDEARVVMYHRPKEYRANIYSSTPAPATAESTLAQFAAALGGGGPRFLYLWWP
jgi:protease-4